jgi:large subunit ribosomal protein L23
MSLITLAKRWIGRSSEPSTKSEAESLEQPVKKRDDERVKQTESYHQTGTSLDLFPIVSEKGVLLQEQGVVSFRVPQSASKRQVVLAIKERYKVEPLSIRMLYGRPKRRRRGRTIGKTTAWKKAYVKVDNVQSITAGP